MIAVMTDQGCRENGSRLARVLVVRKQVDSLGNSLVELEVKA
jgi:hypothetical protein